MTSAQTILSVIAPTAPIAVASGIAGSASAEDGMAFEAMLPGDTPVTDEATTDLVLQPEVAPTPAPPPSVPLLVLAPVTETEATPVVQEEPAPAPVATPDTGDIMAPEGAVVVAANATTRSVQTTPPSGAVPVPVPASVRTPDRPEPVSASIPQLPDGADGPLKAESSPPPPNPSATGRPAEPPPPLRDRRTPSGERLAAGAMEPSQGVTSAASGSASPPGSVASAPASPASATASAAAPQPTAAPVVLDAPPPPDAEGQAIGASTPEARTAHATGRDVSLSGLSRATVETTAQIAAQIVRRLEGRSTRFDMVLTPEHLGRVDVSLEIDSDGRLAARLAFDNPAAATDLRGRADDLRRQLQDAGFNLADDALEFAERHDQPGAGANGFERRPDRRAFASASRLAVEADVPLPAPSRWATLSLTPERVDLKV